MDQRDIQTWNDAVSACRAAAWAVIEDLEATAGNGMANPARTVVREIDNQRKQGDERQHVVTSLNTDDFPKADEDTAASDLQDILSDLDRVAEEEGDVLSRAAAGLIRSQQARIEAFEAASKG